MKDQEQYEEQQEHQQEQQQQHPLQSSKQEDRYVRRPLKRVSRKKFGIALAMLRDAMAAKDLSWKSRLRACELYMILHGEDPHPANRRDRKTCKALVSESAFDKEATAHVRREVLSQTAREARKEAERHLERVKAAEADAAKAEQDRDIAEALAFMRAQVQR